MKYTFAASERDDETTVIASSEDEARNECMIVRWGLPTGYGYDKYKGDGLILLRVEE